MPRRRGKDNRDRTSTGTQHEVVREGQPQRQRGEPPPQAEMQRHPETQKRTGQRAAGLKGRTGRG